MDNKKAIELIKYQSKAWWERSAFLKENPRDFACGWLTIEEMDCRFRQIDQALALLEQPEPAKLALDTSRDAVKDGIFVHAKSQPEAGEFTKDCELLAKDAKWSQPQDAHFGNCLIRQLKQACDIIDRQSKELKDTRLELACPETLGSDNEELYKVAATVVCEKHRLQAKIKVLEEALQDIADHACHKIYSPTCPEIAAQALALLEQPEPAKPVCEEKWEIKNVIPFIEEKIKQFEPDEKIGLGCALMCYGNELQKFGRKERDEQ